MGKGGRKRKGRVGERRGRGEYVVPPTGDSRGEDILGERREFLSDVKVYTRKIHPLVCFVFAIFRALISSPFF